MRSTDFQHHKGRRACPVLKLEPRPETVACYNSDTCFLLADEGKCCVSPAMEDTISSSVCISGRMTNVFLLLPSTKDSTGDLWLHEKKPASLGPVESDPARRGKSGERGSQDPRATTTFQDERKSATQEFPEFAGIRYGPTNRSVSRKDPYLPLKTSWPEIDRRNEKAKMFRGCAARLGTMPQVCPNKVTDGCDGVTSNTPFLLEEDEIAEYHRRIVTETSTGTLDNRTNRHTFLRANVKPLTEAENPWQLSRAWADSLLGVFVVTTLHLLD